MVYSIYAAEDATLYERYYQQNTSKDAIIEIMRYAPSSSYDAYNSRALYKFNITEISQSISSGLIPTGSKYFLSLKCTEAYQLPLEYTIDAFAVSSSWESGIGKFADDPITTAGVSWKYKDSLSDATLWISGSGNWAPDVTGSYAMTAGGGDWYVNYKASQSFNDSSADINMDVTDIFNAWINDTIPNNGLIIKWHETSYGVENLISSLKFFSIDSHTIFLPKVDIKWDDHVYVTQSYSYSTAIYSASRSSQNSLIYPTVILPTQTSTFVYISSSISYTTTTTSLTELTSSYIQYPSQGKLCVTEPSLASLTCSFDGYLIGNYVVSSSFQGSGSGYFSHNGIVEYLQESKSINETNCFGSYFGYFSGSIQSRFTGIISGSFSGSINELSSTYITYDKLYIQFPTKNTYYYISASQLIYATSSTSLPSLTDNTDIIIYPVNLNSFYKQTDKAIIQMNSRPRYPDKIYTTGSMYKKNYRLPETSYYSIKDASSEESIIDFDTTYTKLSCGNQYEGNYFKLWFNAFQPERNYRILIKTVRGDVEEIFDNKFIFKVVR